MRLCDRRDQCWKQSLAGRAGSCPVGCRGAAATVTSLWPLITADPASCVPRDAHIGRSLSLRIFPTSHEVGTSVILVS